MVDKICHYCGMDASTIDHVVPRAVLRALSAGGPIDLVSDIVEGRTLTVPCCSECNSLLGSSFQGSLEERKAYLKKRLTTRYKRVLSIPSWSDKELADMSPRFAEQIMASLRTKSLIKARLSW